MPPLSEHSRIQPATAAATFTPVMFTNGQTESEHRYILTKPSVKVCKLYSIDHKNLVIQPTKICYSTFTSVPLMSNVTLTL